MKVFINTKGDAGLYSVFESLPEEKKNKILATALKEFSENGYEQASTNSIVKEAGISKGILFHYFKTKRDLYLYVVFYSMELMYRRLSEETEFKSRDYFERMREIEEVKLRFYVENPECYKLMLKVFKGSQKDIIEEVYKRYLPLISDYMTKFSSDVDMSVFKEDIDIRKVNDMITWMGEGISERIMQALPEVLTDSEVLTNKYSKEFWEYMELIKRGVCK